MMAMRIPFNANIRIRQAESLPTMAKTIIPVGRASIRHREYSHHGL